MPIHPQPNQSQDDNAMSAFIAAGTYYALLESIREQMEPKWFQKFDEVTLQPIPLRPGAEWTFIISDPSSPHNGDRISSWTSISWNEKSKMFNWANSLMKNKADLDSPYPDMEKFPEEYDECYVNIITKPNKKGKTNDFGKVIEYSFVKSVSPVMPAPPPRPAKDVHPPEPRTQKAKPSPMPLDGPIEAPYEDGEIPF